MAFKYDANKAADDFISMLWDHYADAVSAGSTEELLEYVACDLFSAMQRERLNPDKIIGWAKTWTTDNPATPQPGLFDPEPTPPTFDEALAAKCDADAHMDEARKLKGAV